MPKTSVKMLRLTQKSAYVIYEWSQSIHKICSYVGTSDTTENNEKTKRIRDTANAITNKMADCFDGGSEKDNFYPFFTEQVKKFQEKSSSWPSEKITYLTTEEN